MACPERHTFQGRNIFGIHIIRCIIFPEKHNFARIVDINHFDMYSIHCIQVREGFRKERR